MDSLKFITSISSLPVYGEGATAVEEQFITTQLLVNGEALEGVVFDEYGVLVGHDAAYRKFTLFTCTCGVPECAGYFNSVVQRSTGEQVSWELPAEIAGSPKTLVFDKAQYLEECQLLEQTLNAATLEGIFPYSDLDERAMMHEFEKGDKPQRPFSEVLLKARASFNRSRPFTDWALAHIPGYTLPLLFSTPNSPHTHETDWESLISDVLKVPFYAYSEVHFEQYSKIVLCIQKYIDEGMPIKDLLVKVYGQYGDGQLFEDSFTFILAANALMPGRTFDWPHHEEKQGASQFEAQKPLRLDLLSKLGIMPGTS